MRAGERSPTGVRSAGIRELLEWGVPLSAVGSGPRALLEAADVTPMVAIRLGDEFFDQRAEQRRTILRLADDLSRVTDVRLSRRIANSGSSPIATAMTFVV